MIDNLIIMAAGRPTKDDFTNIKSAIIHTLSQWCPSYEKASVISGFIDIQNEFERPGFNIIHNKFWDKYPNSYSGLLGISGVAGSAFVKYADIVGPRVALDEFIDDAFDIVIGVVPNSTNQTYHDAKLEKLKAGDHTAVQLSEDGDFWYHGVSWLSKHTNQTINDNYEQILNAAKTYSWLDFLIFIAQNFNLKIKAVNTKNVFAEVDRDTGLAKLYLSTKGETLLRLRTDMQSLSIPVLVTINYKEWSENREIVIENLSKSFDAKKRFAVRSSSFAEDSFETSAAGMFESLLNVEFKNIPSAINVVFDSYNSLQAADHIIVQEMVENVFASGVIFSRTLNGENAYQLSIAYGQDTSVITSGKAGDQETYFVSRLTEDLELLPQIVSTVISTVRHLEKFLDYDRLDVEFVISGADEIKIVQVRPLVSEAIPRPISDFGMRRYLYQQKRFLSKYLNREDYGGTPSTILSNMSDWNPAEILGVHPYKLDISLYRYLITDHTWAIQREQAGYFELKDKRLLVEVLGRPYVDAQKSLSSFIPKRVSDETRSQLLSGYLQKLQEDYSLHDKIEFDVAITCFSGNAEQDMEDISYYLQSYDAQIEFFNALVGITRLSIEIADSKFSDLPRIWNDIEELIDGDEIDDPSTILELLDKIREDYALNFAHLARCGFVAVTMLRKNFDEPQVEKILSHIETVNKQLVMDAQKVKEGRLDELVLYDKYGHLRPGSYNILSSTYSSNPKKYLSPIIKSTERLYFKEELDPEIFQNLCANLNQNGIKLDEIKVWAFIKKSIEGRELSKFYFTRLLSYVLDKIKICAENIGIPASEVCMLPISSVIETLNGGYIDELDAEQLYLRTQANKSRYKLQKSFSVPDIITNADDIIFYKQAHAKANFIGSTPVQGKCLQLEADQSKSLQGKIVCIPNADPGYDWIFGHKILGLVTQYGGSNSHMAIRCAELSITAAIGVGPENYEKIVSSDVIEIDPVSQKLIFM